MILVTNTRPESITKSVRIRTIITKTTILLGNHGIFSATDSSLFIYLFVQFLQSFEEMSNLILNR